jgi:mannose-6-phosphate isomerase-like protein (cupin superfamily)
MKLFSLDETPYEPVSHDPGLKKKVLTRGTLPHVKHVSHLILQPEDRASEHVHADDIEVIYCIRGEAEFLIKGERISIWKGHLIFIEPGEVHSIPRVNKETELLYFRVTLKD